MNRQKWKEIITKRSTIWTASLCLVGVIVLGGIASVNSTRNETDGTSDTQNDQLAYLEEDLDSDSSDIDSSIGADTGLEEVSGNTVESLPAESIDSSEGEAPDPDSGNDPGSESTSDTDTDTGSDVSIDTDSDAASDPDADGNLVSDSSESTSNAVSSDISSDNTAGTDGASGEDSGTDTLSESDSDSVEEATSYDIISEAALIEAGVSFSDEQSILWPAAGTVIIDYSMDKSVYFETLNQYKYNPALIISSTIGNQVLASAKGIVESVTIDEETGTTLVLNIGNGYKLTYGQLMEPAVSEGDIVEAGDLLAYISEPTKYYCTEGSNLYFAMTKNGEPVDPVLYLE